MDYNALINDPRYVDQTISEGMVPPDKPPPVLPTPPPQQQAPQAPPPQEQQPPVPQEPPAEWSPQTGVMRGLYGLNTSSRAVLAVAQQVFGIDNQEQLQKIAELSAEKEQKYPAHLKSIMDAQNPKDFLKWTSDIIGESLPFMVPVGGAYVAGAKLAGKLGGAAAAYGTSSALQTGQTAEEQLEATGELSPAPAIAAGAAKGAVEMLVPSLVATGAAQRLGIGKDVVMPFGEKVLKKMNTKQLIGIGATGEAITEALQESIDIAAREYIDEGYLDRYPDEVKDRLINAAAGGAIGGAVFGPLMSPLVETDRKVQENDERMQEDLAEELYARTPFDEDTAEAKMRKARAAVNQFYKSMKEFAHESYGGKAPDSVINNEERKRAQTVNKIEWYYGMGSGRDQLIRGVVEADVETLKADWSKAEHKRWMFEFDDRLRRRKQAMENSFDEQIAKAKKNGNIPRMERLLKARMLATKHLERSFYKLRADLQQEYGKVGSRKQKPEETRWQRVVKQGTKIWKGRKKGPPEDEVGASSGQTGTVPFPVSFRVGAEGQITGVGRDRYVDKKKSITAAKMIQRSANRFLKANRDLFPPEVLTPAMAQPETEQLPQVLTLNRRQTFRSDSLAIIDRVEQMYDALTKELKLTDPILIGYEDLPGSQRGGFRTHTRLNQVALIRLDRGLLKDIEATNDPQLKADLELDFYYTAVHEFGHHTTIDYFLQAPIDIQTAVIEAFLKKNPELQGTNFIEAFATPIRALTLSQLEEKGPVTEEQYRTYSALLVEWMAEEFVKVSAMPNSVLTSVQRFIKDFFNRLISLLQRYIGKSGKYKDAAKADYAPTQAMVDYVKWLKTGEKTPGLAKSATGQDFQDLGVPGDRTGLKLAVVADEVYNLIESTEKLPLVENRTPKQKTLSAERVEELAQELSAEPIMTPAIGMGPIDPNYKAFRMDLVTSRLSEITFAGEMDRSRLPTLGLMGMKYAYQLPKYRNLGDPERKAWLEESGLPTVLRTTDKNKMIGKPLPPFMSRTVDIIEGFLQDLAFELNLTRPVSLEFNSRIKPAAGVFRPKASPVFDIITINLDPLASAVDHDQGGMISVLEAYRTASVAIHEFSHYATIMYFLKAPQMVQDILVQRFLNGQPNDLPVDLVTQGFHPHDAGDPTVIANEFGSPQTAINISEAYFWATDLDSDIQARQAHVEYMQYIRNFAEWLAENMVKVVQSPDTKLDAPNKWLKGIHGQLMDLLEKKLKMERDSYPSIVRKVGKDYKINTTKFPYYPTGLDFAPISAMEDFVYELKGLPGPVREEHLDPDRMEFSLGIDAKYLSAPPKVKKTRPLSELQMPILKGVTHLKNQGKWSDFELFAEDYYSLFAANPNIPQTDSIDTLARYLYHPEFYTTVDKAKTVNKTLLNRNVEAYKDLVAREFLEVPTPHWGSSLFASAKAGQKRMMLISSTPSDGPNSFKYLFSEIKSQAKHDIRYLSSKEFVSDLLEYGIAPAVIVQSLDRFGLRTKLDWAKVNQKLILFEKYRLLHEHITVTIAKTASRLTEVSDIYNEIDKQTDLEELTDSFLLRGDMEGNRSFKRAMGEDVSDFKIDADAKNHLIRTSLVISGLFSGKIQGARMLASHYEKEGIWSDFTLGAFNFKKMMLREIKNKSYEQQLGFPLMKEQPKGRTKSLLAINRTHLRGKSQDQINAAVLNGITDKDPFPQSKVRDENGYLKLLYHGTRSDWAFTRFREGEITYFATDSPALASTYIGYLNRQEFDPDDLYHGTKPKGMYGWGKHIHPVVMDMRNPYVFDAQGRQWNNLSYPLDRDILEEEPRSGTPTTNKLALQAQRMGYDGIIIKNVKDIGTNLDEDEEVELGLDEPKDVYIVWAPEQIKHARGASLAGTTEDAVFYSKSPMTHRARKMAEKVGEKAKGTEITQPVDRWNWFMSMFLNIKQWSLENPHIEGLSQYVEGVNLWSIEQSKWLAMAEEVLKMWQKLSVADQAGLNELIFYIAEGGFLVDAGSSWDTIDLELRHPNADELLKAQKKFKVSDVGMEVYQEITNSFQTILEHVHNLTRTNIMRTYETNLERRAEKMAEVEAEFEELRSRPYFPKMRFGKYAAVLLEGGVVMRVEHHETKAQAMKAGNAMKTPDSKVVVRKVSHMMRSYEGLPLTTLKMIRDHMTPLLSEEQLEYMDDYISEISIAIGARTRLAPSKELPGYSRDALRVYGTYFFRNSKHFARMQYGYILEEAIAKVSADVQGAGQPAGTIDMVKRSEIREAMIKHYNYIMHPKEDWALLRGLAFIWHMGWVPAQAALNFTQIPLVAAPYLEAIFGTGKAIPALTREVYSLRNWLHKGEGKDMTDDYVMALNQAVYESIVDESMAAHLASVASGGVLRMAGSNRLRKWGTVTLQSSSFMFSHIEQVNRRIVFGASYHMTKEFLAAVEAGPGNTLDEQLEARGGKTAEYLMELRKASPEQFQNLIVQVGMDRATAYAYLAARDTVERTQFLYSEHMRPEFMQGKKGVLFAFFMFLQNSLYFAFGKNVKGAQMRYWMYMLAAAGLMGLPGAEDLSDIAEKIARELGYGLNIEKEIREMIIELTDGDVAPDLILNGLSRYGFFLPWLASLGGIPAPEFDMSGNVSMGKVVPGLELLTSSDDYKSRLVGAGEDVAGASYNIGLNMIKAMNDSAYSWDDMKRWERTMPKAVKSLMQAKRYLTEGRERTRTGATMVEFDTSNPQHLIETFLIGVGFKSKRLSDHWDRHGVLKETEQYWTGRRQLLMQRYDQARKLKNREEVKAVMEDIKEFNRDVPYKSLSLGGKSILNSLKQRERARKMYEMGLPVQSRGAIPLARDVQKAFPEVETLGRSR